MSSRDELIAICKEKNIKGYSGKNKQQLLELIQGGESKVESTVEKLTGKFRTDEKDQFYTDEKVAKKCIDIIVELYPETKKYLWIEPSAGNGSFYKNIKYKKIGIDIDPKYEGIIKEDYLKWNYSGKDKKVILVGNPPFGKQSSLAKMFIKRGCEYADIIAFILPKSFTKPSMTNAFDRKFHCMHTSDIEKDAFLIQGNKRYDVPCIFQIWERKSEDRKIEDKIPENGFEYVKVGKDVDIALRRVGVFAGKSFLYEPEKFSTQSHYFIKFTDEGINKNNIIEAINKHTFPSNTVGPRSISKGEVNIVLNEIINQV
jgi:hypothetical protein